MAPLFYCELDVTRHWIKKNRRPIWKHGHRLMVGKDRELIRAELDLTRALHAHRLMHAIQTIDGPIHVRFVFEMPDLLTKEGRVSKRSGDLSNLYQLPEDCLQKAGVIADDALIMSHDGSRKIQADRCRLLIEIHRFHI